jgi:hypothetical protein
VIARGSGAIQKHHTDSAPSSLLPGQCTKVDPSRIALIRCTKINALAQTLIGIVANGCSKKRSATFKRNRFMNLFWAPSEMSQ